MRLADDMICLAAWCDRNDIDDVDHTIDFIDDPIAPKPETTVSQPRSSAAWIWARMDLG